MPEIRWSILFKVYLRFFYVWLFIEQIFDFFKCVSNDQLGHSLWEEGSTIVTRVKDVDVFYLLVTSIVDNVNSSPYAYRVL